MGESSTWTYLRKSTRPVIVQCRMAQIVLGAAQKGYIQPTQTSTSPKKQIRTPPRPRFSQREREAQVRTRRAPGAPPLLGRLVLKLSLFHGLMADSLRYRGAAVGQVSVVGEVNNQAIGGGDQVGHLFRLVRGQVEHLHASA